MKFDKKLKRLADMFEKLGIIGLGLGVYQQFWPAFFLGALFCAASLFLTLEE